MAKYRLGSAHFVHDGIRHEAGSIVELPDSYAPSRTWKRISLDSLPPNAHLVGTLGPEDITVKSPVVRLDTTVEIPKKVLEKLKAKSRKK